MFIPYLLITITLSTQLYGMKNENEWNLYQEIRKKNHTQLSPCSCDPDTIGTIINFAHKSNDRHTMAKLLYLCLPKEVIKEYIAPHFAEDITTKYKHALIRNKCYSSLFEKEMIYYDHTTTLRYHDGTYKRVPSIGCKYALWQAKTYTNTYHIDKNKKIIHHRESIDKSLNLYTPENQAKRFYLQGKNNITITLDFNESSSHYLFSNDNTLVAFGCSEETNYNPIIIDFKKLENLEFSSNGTTSALCSAHHSPIFVIATHSSSVNIGSLSLIKKWDDCLEKELLGQYSGIITCTEFSPDDSRLLACSYSKKNNSSTLLLWNTTNTDQTTLINTTLNCGSKAFFICNGEKIITIQKGGHFSIINGLTGKSIKNNNQDCIAPKLTIWSKKNKLIITAIKNTIIFFSSETGEWLGQESSDWNKLLAIGLTADEQSIIILQKNKQKACRLQLYKEQQHNYFDFIQTKANIIQLYEILNIYNQNKDTSSFVEKIESYI